MRAVVKRIGKRLGVRPGDQLLLAASMLLLVTCLISGHSSIPERASEDGFVSVNGGRLYYEATGSGAAVILLHDGLLHRATWTHQIPVLAETHRAIRDAGHLVPLERPSVFNDLLRSFLSRER